MLANVFTKTTRDRWRGTAIAAASLAAMLMFAMAVYRDIDLAVYTELPEVFRSLMNIPEGADVASLAVGVAYGLYGALTFAALALVTGAGSIAGEERAGTIGLLLGNPRSRTQVMVSKAGAMVVLTALGAAALWLAALIVPQLLNVELGQMAVGAYTLHLFINSLFYGFLAMAIGAWTGNKSLAAGATAGVMIVSLVAVGLLPLIEGLEDLARAFPWYYFDGSEPLINGVHWGHLGLLTAGSVVFAVAALVGINRRDLKGPTVGATLLDRLREHPLTRRVADRLAGSARVSRIWVKTASEHQGLLVVTAAVMFFMMGLLMGPMYTLMDETLLGFADQFPETLLVLFGGGDMSTPEGFYQVETFGMMAPIAVMVVTVAIGAAAVAGEEAKSTIGLLLANPIPRSRLIIEKTWTMIVHAFAVGFATFAGVAGGSLLGGLGMSIGNIAATCLLVTLLGLVFGGLSLVLSAGTGRVKVAVFVTIGAALIAHLFNSFSQLNDGLAQAGRWSPFSYYLGSDPLVNGMHWGNAAVLTGLFVALVGLSIILFSRRDLRQTG